MGISGKEAAAILGVTPARVSQLRRRGELTDMSREGIERLKAERDKRERWRAQYYADEREHRERLLERLDRLIDVLRMLVVAQGGQSIVTVAAALEQRSK